MVNRVSLVSTNVKSASSTCGLLETLGAYVYVYDTINECIEDLSSPDAVQPDLIIVDDSIEKSEISELLSILRYAFHQTAVVYLSGNENIETALSLVSEGVHDFVVKPLSRDRIARVIQTVFDRYHLQKEVTRLRRQVGEEKDNLGFVASSMCMRETVQFLNKAAQSDIPVLFSGESGVGKEVFAKYLHETSARHDKALVCVNCGAIPEGLVESELFGHAKGSFTGAESGRMGKFELADGGTLFLDEIGEMPLMAQVKLLRVLQEGEFSPVGSNEVRKVNVRLVAATNKKLPKLVHEKRFREDLYYRVNVFPIDIPPLRDRGEDILLLSNTFLEKYAIKHNESAKRLSNSAQNFLMQYPWPGNVRQLENVMYRLSLMTDASNITKENLQFLAKEWIPERGQSTVDDDEFITLDNLEKRYIKKVSMHCQGNLSQVARILGVSRSTLYRKIEQIEEFPFKVER
jgi:DNA-binding NtrC family response regulator